MELSTLPLIRDKAMKVKHLTDQIGKPGPSAILWCSYCGAEYSANAGDYFLAAPDTVLLCCEEPLEYGDIVRYFVPRERLAP